MKKLLVLLTVLALLLTLAACGQAEGNDKDDDSEEEIVETQKKKDDDEDEIDEETKKPADEESETEKPKETEKNKDDDEPGNLSSGKKLSFKKKATIEETVIYDKNDIVITAKKLEYGDDEVELDLVIENNSDDDLSFYTGTFGDCCNSVNGYMVNDDVYFSCQVSAGKKAMESLTLKYESLYFYGIEEIADLSIELQIDFDESEKDAIYTGPMVLETSVKSEYKYENTYKAALESKAVNKQLDIEVLNYGEDDLYDEEGIELLSYSWITMDDNKYLLMEFCNDSDENADVRIMNLVVNELTVDIGSTANLVISKGKKGVAVVDIDLIFSDDYYENLGIEHFSTLNMDIEVWNMENETVVPAVNVDIKLDDKLDTSYMEGKEVYNSDGVRILEKGLYNDDYLDRLYWIFLIENKMDKDINVYDEYDSLSVNGFMVEDYYTYSYSAKAGKNGIFIVSVDKEALDKIDVSEKSDIEDYEISIDINDKNYKTLASSKLKSK